MQFEILNTIQWVAYWMVLLVVFATLRVKLDLKDVLKFKYFFITLLVTSMASHQQFYTLTEMVDVERTTQKFTFSSNNSTIDNYLEDNTDKAKKRTDEERDLELMYQQQKSATLAKQIEQQSKEK